MFLLDASLAVSAEPKRGHIVVGATGEGGDCALLTVQARQ
jgi:hypothetical protein